jgi:hypothetical protein
MDLPIPGRIAVVGIAGIEGLGVAGGTQGIGTLNSFPKIIGTNGEEKLGGFGSFNYGI